MDASPGKRRALATLDPNASPKPRVDLDQIKPAQSTLSASPLKRTSSHTSSSLDENPKKRSLYMDAQTVEDQPSKKPCLETPVSPESNLDSGEEEEKEEEEEEEDHHSERSASPGASSVFDNSALDRSQDTTLTEPDMEPNPAFAAIRTSLAGHLPHLPPRPRLTREQARERAEILRLRLGLASYKLRTGQTDVPLDQLQIRPVLDSAPVLPLTQALVELQDRNSAPARRPLPNSPQPSEEQVPFSSKSSDDCSDDEDDEDDEPAQAESQPSMLPRLNHPAINTPARRRLDEDDLDLTSSALRGGAANGLLSLSMTRS